MTAAIELDQVTKKFAGGVVAVDDVTLTIADGEFMVLVGPSGCGKSTLLRMIAGLEEVTDGAISIGGVDVTDYEPADRDIAMVFQNYALYPHMSVAKNLGYGLKVRKTSKGEIERRVQTVAQLLGLEDLLQRRPGALSGGQRQRVAMGRAIVRQPAVFLMDEPLSNLDAKLRVQMRADIKKIQRDLSVTTVYVTHDQIEAMTMGDRVAVMRKAELQQVAPPQELYDRPVNMFVAGFIGSPAMNMLEAKIDRLDGQLVVTFGSSTVVLNDAKLAKHAPLASFVGREVVLGIRPEDLEDAALSDGDRPRLVARVTLREALGSEVLVHFTIDARQAMTDEMRELAEDVGDDRGASQFAAGATATAAALVGRFSPRTKVVEGDTVEVSVDPQALHFFDPTNGAAIYGQDA